MPSNTNQFQTMEVKSNWGIYQQSTTNLTATLAKKNSEATRALAVQSDILEKEVGEIQKVLLAMQEQQQKQLDLILTIGKASKLWESKHETREG
ncbi:hypothetical protein ACSQ67_004624 [Phaseolus vulgaris]